MYFKHVYSPNPEIVNIAHEGLRDVLEQQNKLPKEILQSGLRPILVNLADAKRLSVSGLDGLARFLELLNNYFKVEIGVKLLDHFATLGDQQMFLKAAFSPLDDNPDVARMTRLVKIFRLLPGTAVQFLDNLVQQVVDVETNLQQSSPGPFTENLALYLNRYYDEGAQNLIDHLSNPRYIVTYRNVIASGHAPDFVNSLSNRIDEVTQATLSNPESTDLVLSGLRLIKEIASTSPNWLPDRQPVLEALVGIWRNVLEKSRDPSIDMSGLQYQEIPALLLDLFMMTLKQKQHIALLFHVVEAYEIRSSIELSHISFFLYEQVALQESVEYRRDVLEHFIGLYEGENVTWTFKTNALRTIVNPTLRAYFVHPKNDGSLVTPRFVSKLSELMWVPYSSTASAKEREDTLLIEIFALTGLLFQYCPSRVEEVRKHAFKMAWMGVNLLEPTVKLMAYITVARFLFTWESPIKFVRLTWTGLLRLKDNESRPLFRQAIDLIAQTIPVRDAQPTTGVPEWAQRVRNVLIEESSGATQVVTVCELLVNHPDLFYDYRELYVPHIASSLNKLAFVQAATNEMKRLTVDIVELIFKWEKRRMAARDEAMDVDEQTAKRTRHGSPEPSTSASVKKRRVDRAGTAASSGSGGGWAAPGQVREVVTAHLLRLVATSSEPMSRGSLSKRALDLFKEILGPKGLPNVNVKLGFFQRTMTSVSSAVWPCEILADKRPGNQREHDQHGRQLDTSHRCCRRRPRSELGQIESCLADEATREVVALRRDKFTRDSGKFNPEHVQGDARRS